MVRVFLLVDFEKLFIDPFVPLVERNLFVFAFPKKLLRADREDKVPIYLIILHLQA